MREIRRHTRRGSLAWSADRLAPYIEDGLIAKDPALAQEHIADGKVYRILRAIKLGASCGSQFRALICRTPRPKWRILAPS
jgi:hypothetical protein